MRQDHDEQEQQAKQQFAYQVQSRMLPSVESSVRAMFVRFSGKSGSSSRELLRGGLKAAENVGILGIIFFWHCVIYLNEEAMGDEIYGPQSFLEHNSRKWE